MLYLLEKQAGHLSAFARTFTNAVMQQVIQQCNAVMQQVMQQGRGTSVRSCAHLLMQ
jgi:hypothetical protein